MLILSTLYTVNTRHLSCELLSYPELLHAGGGGLGGGQHPVHARLYLPATAAAGLRLLEAALERQGGGVLGLGGRGAGQRAERGGHQQGLGVLPHLGSVDRRYRW